MTICEDCKTKTATHYIGSTKQTILCFDCIIKPVYNRFKKKEIKKNENGIKKQVIDYCNGLGLLVIIFDNENKKGNKSVQLGLPDLLILFNGKTLFIELKNIGTTSRVYQEQVEWKNKLRAQGFSSHVCYGFDDAKYVIDEFKKG